MKQKSKNLWCRHGICFAVIGVSLIVLLIILGCFLLFRGSARLEAEIDYEPKDNITLYGQNDIRWAQKKLGKSRYIMKSSGCLVSCIAMAVTMSEMEITPGELNELFSENLTYDEEGEYLCLDPLEDEVTRLSRYGNRVYSFRCVWYEKPQDISLYESLIKQREADQIVLDM